MFLTLTLIGCAYEFGITATPEKPYADDTASEQVDTAVSDTGTTGEETGSATTDDSGDPPQDTGETDSTPPEDTGTADTGTADTSPPEDTAVDVPPADDCDHTSDLIYVLSRDDGRLYTFDPPSSTFTSVGVVDCDTTQSPESMAVGRDGTAYVRYGDDAVFAIDLATMRCSGTDYSPRRSGFDSFGMGFATDSSDTWRDHLYVANGSTVGVMDTATWSISNLGSMPSQSELTGNADGELWAILPLERPAQLRRIDTTSGATLETIRPTDFPSTSDIDTFAFATWNGDFYIFIRMYGMGSTTDVYKVTRDGTLTTAVTDVGFNIVGAGVSTCAPS